MQFVMYGRKRAQVHSLCLPTRSRASLSLWPGVAFSGEGVHDSFSTCVYVCVCVHLYLFYIPYLYLYYRDKSIFK